MYIYNTVAFTCNPLILIPCRNSPPFNHVSRWAAPKHVFLQLKPQLEHKINSAFCRDILTRFTRTERNSHVAFLAFFSPVHALWFRWLFKCTRTELCQKISAFNDVHLTMYVSACTHTNYSNYSKCDCTPSVTTYRKIVIRSFRNSSASSFHAFSNAFSNTAPF